VCVCVFLFSCSPEDTPAKGIAVGTRERERERERERVAERGGSVSSAVSSKVPHYLVSRTGRARTVSGYAMRL